MKLFTPILLSLFFAFSAHAEIEINDAWARATAPSARTGAIYMTLKNTGNKEDFLIAAESDMAARTEVHKTSMDDDGMMSMDHMDEVRVSSGVEVMFAPGGYHIMLMGLKNQLQPDYEIPLTLTFKKAGERSVRVPIKPIHYRPRKH